MLSLIALITSGALFPQTGRTTTAGTLNCLRPYLGQELGNRKNANTEDFFPGIHE
jgi:hypothetical protein